MFTEIMNKMKARWMELTPQRKLEVGGAIVVVSLLVIAIIF